MTNHHLHGIYQTLNEDKSTSVIYRLYDDDIGAMHNGDKIYSSVDDEQYAGEYVNIQSAMF